MIEYNTLLEVPVEIREFYEEVVVSEPTGETVWEDYDYTDIDGTERVGQRLVDEYADVTYIKELPRHDLKSWDDVSRVKAKGRVKTVPHFITKACEADNWTSHDKYVKWLEEEPLIDDEKYLLTTTIDDVEVLTHSFTDDITTWQEQEPVVSLRDSAPLISAYTTEQEDIAAKAIIDAQKLAGIDYNGVPVSLTEENQNGLSSVMGGAKLAAEYGGTIFPLNFNAATASGVQVITFIDLPEFELFALGFMQARQAFFA